MTADTASGVVKPANHRRRSPEICTLGPREKNAATTEPGNDPRRNGVGGKGTVKRVPRVDTEWISLASRRNGGRRYRLLAALASHPPRTILYSSSTLLSAGWRRASLGLVFLSSGFERSPTLRLSIEISGRAPADTTSLPGGRSRFCPARAPCAILAQRRVAEPAEVAKTWATFIFPSCPHR